ncbi:MAG: hypothetical protein HOQ36_04795, partial [Nocardia sp.]|nr:hypothetical protein [Nocardia sp.]
MPLQLPPWLPPIVVECVAGHFPRGDEDAMRATADHWSRTADEYRADAIRYDAEADKVADGARGQGGDSQAANYRELAAKSRAQADYNDSLAAQLYENANNTELTKWTVYGFALHLA